LALNIDNLEKIIQNWNTKKSKYYNPLHRSQMIIHYKKI